MREQPGPRIQSIAWVSVRDGHFLVAWGQLLSWALPLIYRVTSNPLLNLFVP